MRCLGILAAFLIACGVAFAAPPNPVKVELKHLAQWGYEDDVARVEDLTITPGKTVTPFIDAWEHTAKAAVKNRTGNRLFCEIHGALFDQAGNFVAALVLKPAGLRLSDAMEPKEADTFEARFSCPPDVLASATMLWVRVQINGQKPPE